jgi:hypothetical protein
VVDRRLQAVEIGDRLFEPAKRLAQSRVDLLEAFDVRLALRRLANGLVFGAQFVE